MIFHSILICVTAAYNVTQQNASTKIMMRGEWLIMTENEHTSCGLLCCEAMPAIDNVTSKKLPNFYKSCPKMIALKK